MGFLDGDTAQHLIAHYGYAAIFLVVMLESAGIPMPGNDPDQCRCTRGHKARTGYSFGHSCCRGRSHCGDNVTWYGREFGEPLLETG